MQALAQAKKGAAMKALGCLLECTKGTQFEVTLDDECLQQIGQVLHADYPVGDTTDQSDVDPSESNLDYSRA